MSQGCPVVHNEGPVRGMDDDHTSCPYSESALPSAKAREPVSWIRGEIFRFLRLSDFCQELRRPPRRYLANRRLH